MTNQEKSHLFSGFRYCLLIVDRYLNLLTDAAICVHWFSWIKPTDSLNLLIVLLFTINFKNWAACVPSLKLSSSNPTPESRNLELWPEEGKANIFTRSMIVWYCRSHHLLFLGEFCRPFQCNRNFLFNGVHIT